MEPAADSGRVADHPCSTTNRSRRLAGHREWLRPQFAQHHGNAELVRQELLQQKGNRVSLRTVERAAQARPPLRQSRQATVRYETRPGQQLQADFDELWVPIGGVGTKVHICVLTLGNSRRLVVRVFRQQRQPHWTAAAGGGLPLLGWQGRTLLIRV